MSDSKSLPPFIFDLLYYLNRDQLERFSIVCRPLKNLIERHFHSKPYRIFGRLEIYGGSYVLYNNKGVRWHPNRDDYSVQQFLAGLECSTDASKYSWRGDEYHSFAKMRPYLGSNIRINWTAIYVAEDSIYNCEHVAEMESIAYLWHDGQIIVQHYNDYCRRIVAEDFQLILNSPKILQCRLLVMDNAHFSFKDYKVLFTVHIINVNYGFEVNDANYWQEFLEQPGVKPIVVLRNLQSEKIDKVLDRLSKAFSSAVLPNAFKLVFAQLDEELTEFRKTNNTSGEILELKKRFQVDVWVEDGDEDYHNYTLERSSV